MSNTATRRRFRRQRAGAFWRIMCLVSRRARLLTVLSVTEIVVVGKDQHTDIANRHEAVIVNAIGSHGVTELRRRGREVAGPWERGDHAVERRRGGSYSIDHRGPENPAKIHALVSGVVPNLVRRAYARNGGHERKAADIDHITAARNQPLARDKGQSRRAARGREGARNLP